MTRQAQAKKTRTYMERQHQVAEVAEHSIAMRKLMERFPAALTVTDATEDKVLLVTDRDVSRGQPANPAGCALAQCAIRQGLGGMIGREFAYLIKGTEVTRYHLGRHASAMTAVFDKRGTMEPGPVVLSAPAPSQRLVEMGRRLRIHRAAAGKRRKPKSRAAAYNQKRADRLRQHIVTRGFRTWDRA